MKFFKCCTKVFDIFRFQIFQDDEQLAVIQSRLLLIKAQWLSLFIQMNKLVGILSFIFSKLYPSYYFVLLYKIIIFEKKAKCDIFS